MRWMPDWTPGVIPLRSNIPPNFQRDVLAGRQPDIQVNVDATRMSQAFTGNGYIQNIINGEVNSFVARYRDNSERCWYALETRMRFNPNLDPACVSAG